MFLLRRWNVPEICADIFLSFAMFLTNGEYVPFFLTVAELKKEHTPAWNLKALGSFPISRILPTQGPMYKGFYHSFPSNFIYLTLGSWLVSLCGPSSRDETFAILFVLSAAQLILAHPELHLRVPSSALCRNLVPLIGICTSNAWELCSWPVVVFSSC